MRDYLLLALIIGSLPFLIVFPYAGLLEWTWIGLTNPHRYTWGLAYRFPVVEVVAAATLIGLLCTRKRRGLPLTTQVVLLVGLWASFTLSSYFAFYPERAWLKWMEVSKALVLTFVTIMLVTTTERLRGLYWTLALAMGIIGLKGGIFSLATGGHYRVYGPPQSMLADNNFVGAALNMTLPILFYLAKGEKRPYLKYGLWFTFWMSAVSVLFTYSRGAFLGLGTVAVVLLLQSRRKFVFVGVALAILLVASAAMPQEWISRMSTLKKYEDDASAIDRLNEWKFARNVAADRPLTGGGFKVYSQATYSIYLPEFGNWWDSHSIYFGMLAEHGYPGFGLFVGLIVSALWSLRRLKRAFGPERVESSYCDMVTGSICAFAVSGAFLDLHYFEMFYQLIGTIVVLKRLQRELPPASPAEVRPTTTHA